MSDQATYTCVARNAQGYSVRGTLEVQVMGKFYKIILFIRLIPHLAIEEVWFCSVEPVKVKNKVVFSEEDPTPDDHCYCLS